MVELVRKIIVLRWGHRNRDQRLTSHLVLAARAFGASGFILADSDDRKIEEMIAKVQKRWGGSFSFAMGIPWRRVVKEWRGHAGLVVHLTAYGENIQTSDVLERIKAAKKDLLVIVGSQKVPSAFFTESISDFNVAIGNQPHSECSSLAVFLDRFFEGNELSREFPGATLRIISQARGKKVARI